jgi:hypothetical protein
MDYTHRGLIELPEISIKSKKLSYQINKLTYIYTYKRMLKNYDRIMPFLIGIKKKKISLDNDIIYKLKKLLA